MNSAAAYGASKQYVDIHTGTLEKLSWGAIEGSISNQTDLATALNNKKDTMKKMKIDFNAKWGNISLCANTLSDFDEWLTDAWNKYITEGNQEFWLPYQGNLMVQVFIDKNNQLPIRWTMNNKWYAMGQDGIIEIGENDFVKQKQGTDKANKIMMTNSNGDVITTEIIDCGAF